MKTAQIIPKLFYWIQIDKSVNKKEVYTKGVLNLSLHCNAGHRWGIIGVVVLIGYILQTFYTTSKNMENTTRMHYHSKQIKKSFFVDSNALVQLECLCSRQKALQSLSISKIVSCISIWSANFVAIYSHEWGNEQFTNQNKRVLNAQACTSTNL